MPELDMFRNDYVNPHGLTPQQVADICGVSVSTVYAWISRREIASSKFGNSRFISYQQIQDMYLKRRTGEFVDRRYANGPIRS